VSGKSGPAFRSGPSARVLVVDDEGSSLRLLSALLAREGYEPHPLSDPRRAMGEAKSLRPDLIILDFVMPGLLGSDLAVALKSDPDTLKVPILILSGMADEDVRTIARWSGAAAFLEKLWDEAVLLSTVQRLVKEH